jgi:hypothetical protein
VAAIIALSHVRCVPLRPAGRWVCSAVLVLLASQTPAGCGQKPVARITANFEQNHVIFASSLPALNLTLRAVNVGNQTLHGKRGT